VQIINTQCGEHRVDDNYSGECATYRCWEVGRESCCDRRRCGVLRVRLSVVACRVLELVESSGTADRPTGGASWRRSVTPPSPPQRLPQLRSCVIVASKLQHLIAFTSDAPSPHHRVPNFVGTQQPQRAVRHEAPRLALAITALNLLRRSALPLHSLTSFQSLHYHPINFNRASSSIFKYP
jgi:hypothetical protein